MCFPKTIEVASSALTLTFTGLLPCFVFEIWTVSEASSVVVVWTLASDCSPPFADISVPLNDPLLAACFAEALALCSAFIFAISSSTMGWTRGTSLIVKVAVLIPRAWRRSSSAAGSTPWRCASAYAIRRASCWVGCANAITGTNAMIQSRFLNFMRFYLGFRCFKGNRIPASTAYFHYLIMITRIWVTFCYFPNLQPQTNVLNNGAEFARAKHITSHVV